MNHIRSFILVFLILGSLISIGQTQKTYENFRKQLDLRNYKEANKCLDMLLEKEPKNNYWLFSKAEVESLLGNKKSALQYLELSVNNGYVQLEGITSNKDLGNISSTPEFKKIVAQLEEKLSKYKLSETEQKITVDIPPMMECYAIMLYLGNPNHPLINRRKNHAYYREIDHHFEKYKQHPDILQLARKYPGDTKEWINNLRAHHNLRTLYAFDSMNIDVIKRFPIEFDYDLARLIKHFATESNFMEFYNSSKEFYTAMKKVMLTNYAFGSNLIPFFNGNFDMRINRFNIYFSPIYGDWQHGPAVRMGNYIECFYFGGIMYSNTKQFYYPDIYLLFTFLTEFDHTPINALTDTFEVEFFKYKSKLPLLNGSGHVSYGDIKSTMNEYLTWTFGLQYFYEHTPSEYPEIEKNIINNMEKNRGFIRFGEFMEFYKTYINNRDKYPKLKDFYPQIIKWISNLQ